MATQNISDNKSSLPLPIPQQNNNSQYIEQLTTQLSSYISNMIQNKSITTGNVLLVIADIMQVVEGYKNLNGLDKKTLVLNCIKTQIDNNSSMTLEEKTSLSLIVNTMASPFIDTVVAASNGDLNLNKICKCCF